MFELLAPLLSRHPTNPVGQTLRIRRASAAIKKRLQAVERFVLAELERIPVITNAALRNKHYEYQISVDALRLIIQQVEEILRTDDGREAMARAVREAYREGTAKAGMNLSRLSEDYTREVTSLLRSDPVTRRAALAAARVFELMDGFDGDVTSDLSYELFRAVQDGENPRVTARKIRKRFKTSRARANRIARTEITGALRRGRWDEARDTKERLGLNIFLLHQSALIPGRTRRTHAARHGAIVTIDDQAEWYAENGNSSNCLCSTSEIILGEDGEPISGGKLIDRMKKARDNFLGRS